MAAIRIIDDHIQLASIGSKTHAAIEGHIQGIGNYAFPAADGGADQVLKTNGAGVLAWIDKNHSIASHNDTTATGAQLDTLVDNSIADALHRHSELVASDGSPDPALKVDASGNVGIGVTPSVKLEVNGYIKAKQAAAVQVILEDTSRSIDFRIGTSINNKGWIGTISNHPLDLRTNNTVRIFINTNGHIGIGTSTPATSALLDLTSTTGALLLTRMTTTQRDALTAVNGMLIYNSTLNKFQGRENGAWTSFI